MVQLLLASLHEVLPIAELLSRFSLQAGVDVIGGK